MSPLARSFIFKVQNSPGQLRSADMSLVLTFFLHISEDLWVQQWVVLGLPSTCKVSAYLLDSTQTHTAVAGKTEDDPYIFTSL